MRSVVLLSLLLCCSATLGYDDKTEGSSEHAAAYWKSNVRHSKTKTSEAKTRESQTEHAVIYGTLDAKQLESIGKATERAIVFAQKSVGYDKEVVKRPNQQMTDRPYHWEGKLIVFACKERQEFNDLFYRLKQAKPDANEVSVYVHDKGRTYVLLGPASQNRKLNNEVLAVEQAGAGRSPAGTIRFRAGSPPAMAGCWLTSLTAKPSQWNEARFPSGRPSCTFVI